jgi:hypothetical protein
MMEKIMYNRGNGTTEQPTTAPLTQSVDQNMSSQELDSFDFERYLTEIWDGQNMAFGGLDSTFGTGMQGEIWDDIARRL